MRKKIIKASIVFCIVFNVALVCSMEPYASPIQEEQVNKTAGVNGQINEAIENIKDSSLYTVSEEKLDISEDSSADTGIVEKYIENLPHGDISSEEDRNVLNEHIDSNKGIDINLADPFPKNIKTLKIPSYTLAKDFPQEHVKTFNDFLLFCASLVSRDQELHLIIARDHPDFYKKIEGTIYQHPIVKIRLELNNPVRYEDFLAAVFLSICYRFPMRKFGLDHRIIMCSYYIQMFMHQCRNSFFMENILAPLSHDLANGKYRGYRFKSNNLPQFFREFIDNCYDRKMELISHYEMFGIVGRPFPPITLILPEEFYLLNYYAQTLLLVHKGKLNEAYKELYRHKMPRAPYSSIPPYFSYSPFGSGVTPSYEYRLLPPRPYYYYNDDDRYHWFEFLQAELRSAGRFDYADSILETEIEHFRELIIWQLQLRAYLTSKLYEYEDDSNLSTLRDLLSTEYIAFIDDPEFQTVFENAIEELRNIDDKVRATSSIEKGEIILPWIDRDAINRKQGIECESLSPEQNLITLSTVAEGIDDVAKEEMKKSYEKAIYYIRVMAVAIEQLYQKNDLETMVELHSKLVSNTNINCTPTGIYRKDFTSKINGGGEKNQELEPQIGQYSRYSSRYTDDQIFEMFLRYHGLDYTVKDSKTVKKTIIDSEDNTVTELSPQEKLDQRRYDLIVNDFWGHQARRKNGDMTVGEIILPWIEVQGK